MKTNVWKIVGIILIIVSILLFLNNIALYEEIDEWYELTGICSDLVDEWCYYSNDLIVFSNDKVWDDYNMPLNEC